MELLILEANERQSAAQGDYDCEIYWGCSCCGCDEWWTRRADEKNPRLETDVAFVAIEKVQRERATGRLAEVIIAALDDVRRWPTLFESIRAVASDVRHPIDMVLEDAIADVLGGPRAVCVDGNLSPSAFRRAEALYHENAFEHVAILADAVEESGCMDAEVLAHLRDGGRHYRGCWAVDAILGRR
jgi:hypothetical protein